ncbi:MAG: XRE family transcriptional regulator [Neisseriaceae bacterium]|nr:XRE family transcriptional regulator [Neisseriaceae bacterium]
MDSKTTHITPINGNVFVDLGFEPEVAKQLKAHSDMIIQAKLTLAKSVSDWIDENQLKQEQAAEILNISRPRVSDVVNCKVSKFSIDALIAMLAKTGKHIQFNIS